MTGNKYAKMTQDIKILSFLPKSILSNFINIDVQYFMEFDSE